VTRCAAPAVQQRLLCDSVCCPCGAQQRLLCDSVCCPCGPERLLCDSVCCPCGAQQRLSSKECLQKMGLRMCRMAAPGVSGPQGALSLRLGACEAEVGRQAGTTRLPAHTRRWITHLPRTRSWARACTRVHMHALPCTLLLTHTVRLHICSRALQARPLQR